jgi:hypothetical protein
LRFSFDLKPRAYIVFALLALSGAAFGQANNEDRDDGLRPVPEAAGSGRAAAIAAQPGSGAGTTGFVSTNVSPRTAAVPAGSVIASAAPTLRPEPVTVEDTTGPVPRPRVRRIEAEEDPFAPVGIPVGSFVMRPSIEISAGYDDNPLRTPQRRGSRVGRVEAHVEMQSNWSRHELVGELRGGYTKYFDVEHNDRPEAEAAFRGRIDVTSLSRIELEGRAALSTQAAGSPDAVTAAERPPNVYTLAGTVGYVQGFNRFELGLHGDLERNIHESAKLIAGGTQDLSDQNFTTYGIRVRGSYELSPGIRTFVETGFDRRVFDREIDANGARTGSDGFVARAGFAFDRHGVLTGEVSAGYTHRRYRDAALGEISGLVLDSSLIWQASALTTVTLQASTDIAETGLADSSGVLTREAKIIVDHAFRRWLTGSLAFGYGADDYRGAGRRDQRLELSAALTYHLSRYAALKGEYRHERLTSSEAGADYAANVVFFGLRLQR